MAQEFHVLQCCECEVFQVHQVKKSSKWNCKMCGLKQSIKQVYGKGSAVECRHNVQKLNLLKGLEKSDFNANFHKSSYCSENDCLSSPMQTQDECYKSNLNVIKSPHESKWLKFCENEEPDDECYNRRIAESEGSCLSEDEREGNKGYAGLNSFALDNPKADFETFQKQDTSHNALELQRSAKHINNEEKLFSPCNISSKQNI